MKMGRIFGGSGLGRNRDRRRNHVAVGRHVPVLPPPEDAAFALEPWWRPTAFERGVEKLSAVGPPSRLPVPIETCEPRMKPRGAMKPLASSAGI
jgi:hypothetical protein